MQRRTRKTWGRLSFSAIVGLLAVGVACGQMPVQEAKAVQASRPNVLVFLTDDQRLAGTMAVLPHVLRWLEGGGRNFPLMFDTTPLCCPSRATLFTGLFAHNHGIVDNRHVGRDVFDQATTIQRYLDEAGYRTGLFGKLFNFWRVEDDPAYFDRWGIFHPTNRESGYLEATWNIQGELRDVRRYSTDFIAAQGVQFIRQAEAHDDDPWFLELSTYAPHLGAVVAPEYQDAPVGPFRATPAMLERDRSDKPPAVRREHTSRAKMRSARADQLRLLMSVDDLVARIARALRRSGEMRDTLVIFLSDNGYLWGEHGIHAKGYPYTPDVQVPLFIRWPNHVSRGSTDRRLTAMVDIAPTILDAAGIEQDPDLPMDGRSLLDGSWSRPRVLMEYWYWSGAKAPPWASLWTRRFQYTEYYDEDGSISFREYYDLRNDPWQLTNLLHDGEDGNEPDVAALHDRLTTDRACAGSACP